MRFIALFLTLTSLIFAEGFPRIFNSAGDDIYENMYKYLKIKDLNVYADRPEVLESFCQDANASLARGYALDKMQEDPEASIDKVLIKSYAKELRRLSSQNESIQYHLSGDIDKLYEAKDFKSLRVFQEAKIELNTEIIKAIEADTKKQKQAKDLAVVRAKAKTAVKPIAVSAPVKVLEKAMKKPVVKVVPVISKEVKVEAPVLVPKVIQPIKKEPLAMEENRQAKSIEKPVAKVVPIVPKEVKLESPVLEETQIASKIQEPVIAIEKKSLTKLEYYEQSIIHLKEELYELRESGDQINMDCLNDITAINYWMISMLKNENDACTRRDAIKQMKSYDKSSLNSCGRGSLRYTEWHGRIKPYVGAQLFKAEADCHQ